MEHLGICLLVGVCSTGTVLLVGECSTGTVLLVGVVLPVLSC